MVVIQTVVNEKIKKILELLKERKNKTDNVNTLVETSLSVLLEILNKKGNEAGIFTELANTLLNHDEEHDIDNVIEKNQQTISSQQTDDVLKTAKEFMESVYNKILEQRIKDVNLVNEAKENIKLLESFKTAIISTNNVEQLVDISTKVLEEISKTVAEPPIGKDIQQSDMNAVQPVVETGLQPVVQPSVQQSNTTPTISSAPASTYYNSMIKKNSDIGTFLAAAIGNSLVDKKPTMINNILTGLTKTGTVFKNYFKGIDINAMKARLSSLSLPSGTMPNAKIPLSATNDIFRLTIGYTLAFIKYCAEKGIKISRDMTDSFKHKTATILDPNAGKKPTEENIIQEAQTNKNNSESDTDKPEKEVNCSDPSTIKLGQVEDTALCFDPKENKVIANENKDENENNK
jgi:hypothetical protein